jgi:CHAT domain-containing protein
VDDLATSLFSIMYYEERMKGLSCSTAIQSAQKRLKNFRSSQISDFPLLFDFLSVVAEQDIYTQRITELFHQEYPFSSPYWWAAFTCQGIY